MINNNFINKIRSKLKENNGNMYIVTGFLIMLIICITFVFAVFYEVKVIGKDVKDKIQISVIKSVVNNYENVYHGTRQSIAKAYKPTNDDWKEIVNIRDIYTTIAKELNLKEENGVLVKYADNDINYKLSNLKIEVTNVSIDNKNNLNRFTSDVSIMLEIPREIGGIKQSVKIKLRLKAGYINKF